MKKFWKWTNELDAEERVLEIDGTIAEESWFDDDVTPRMFKEELLKGSGPITIWINSPGGDCIAASQIYSMLLDYKGDITVKIDGIAASAASVIAMAGNKLLMSPTSLLMIHNPAITAFGDHRDMAKAIDLLNEVKESIINSYEIKTGLSRTVLSHMMDDETWMNAKKAVELKFADGILEDEKKHHFEPEAYEFSIREFASMLMNKISSKGKPEVKEESGRDVKSLKNKLETIKKVI